MIKHSIYSTRIFVAPIINHYCKFARVNEIRRVSIANTATNVADEPLNQVFTETKDCRRIDLPTASNTTEPDFEADSLSYSIIGFYLLDEEDREALMNLSNIDHLRPTIEPENAQVKNVH